MEPHPHIHWECPVQAEVIGRPIARVVSLVPSLSETMVALGLADRLVGVTEYCVHPADAFGHLPKLGGTKDADVEAIWAVSPDLVIANQEENTARVVRALADRGIDVWVTYPRTVEAGVQLVEEVASLGAAAAAVEVVVTPVREAFERAKEAKARRDAAGRRGPRIFCPIWRDPWMTIGADTYIHDLLVLCGGEHCFPGSSAGDEGHGKACEKTERRYPILNLEDLKAFAPDIVLLPDEPYAFSREDQNELSALDLPAAATGRIHLIDGTLVSWYGPRIAEAIQVLGGFIAIP